MDIRVKDFAKEHGITAEGVYKKLRRKPPELEGHVHRYRNATWLDDVAQTYLVEKMNQSPIVISDGAEARKLEKLQQDNSNLQAALIAAQQQIITTQKQLADAAVQQYQLTASKDAAKEEAEQLRQQVTDLQAKLEEEQSKSLWQRVFGK